MAKVASLLTTTQKEEGLGEEASLKSNFEGPIFPVDGKLYHIIQGLKKNKQDTKSFANNKHSSITFVIIKQCELDFCEEASKQLRQSPSINTIVVTVDLATYSVPLKALASVSTGVVDSILDIAAVVTSTALCR